MDFSTLEVLKVNHRAWKLLRADNATLIISFLHRYFIEPNERTFFESELISRLEDYLFHLRRESGSEKFPREPRAYLEDWASDKHGWLRKYYTTESDEPSFDIMPATE